MTVQERSDSMKTCPTRIDETQVLFAHTIDQTTCQGRQRKHYHKCFTCVHNNAHQGLPLATPKAPTLETPSKRPARNASRNTGAMSAVALPVR